MTNFKEVRLEDILTSKEIIQVKKLYKETELGKFNNVVVRSIVWPNYDRSIKTLEKPLAATYIGYAIEYCLMKEKPRPKSIHRKIFHKKEESYVLEQSHS